MYTYLIYYDFLQEPQWLIVLDLMLDMSFSVTSAACITAVQCTILLFHFPTRLVFPYSMKKKTYQSRSVSSINDYASSSLWLTPSPMLKYMQKGKSEHLSQFKKPKTSSWFTESKLLECYPNGINQFAKSFQISSIDVFSVSSLQTWRIRNWQNFNLSVNSR